MKMAERLMENLYLYKARCLRTVDGDTLDLEIDLGLHVSIKQRVRLYGIDTPEVYGRKVGSEEYEAGKLASARTKELVMDKQLWIETIKDKTGKYGRYLVRIWVKGMVLHPDNPDEEVEKLICVNSTLVEEGFAEWRTY